MLFTLVQGCHNSITIKSEVDLMDLSLLASKGLPPHKLQMLKCDWTSRPTLCTLPLRSLRFGDHGKVVSLKQYG